MKGVLACLAAAAFAGSAAAQVGLPATPLRVEPPRAAQAPAAKETTAAAVVLAGKLDPELWRAYAARFVTEDGRVVDTANGQISHSEGQGYGLVLAVAADDRAGFERIWGWTRANLLVRGDELLAWRWEPGKRPAVADMNNATDGDILVAWALTEAAETWKEAAYRVAARRIATEIGRRAVLFRAGADALLLPGVGGFAAADRPDGPVVNLSYWVYPAFQRLPIVAPEFDWDRLIRTGLALNVSARFGPSALPTEWISVRDGRHRPADGFPAVFSYNAIRIPLYLAWAGITATEQLGPYATLWGERQQTGLPVVEVAGGVVRDWMREPGYGALPALLACAADASPLPGTFRQLRPDENYYPATLQLLALVAAKTRFPRCLPE